MNKNVFNFTASDNQIKEIQVKCFDNLGIKVPKKDAENIVIKTKEANEAEEMLHKSLEHWPELKKESIAEFREIFKSTYGEDKDLSDYEVSDMAHRMSVIAMMQTHREAGEAIRKILIKYKKVEINLDDVEKLKKLFNLAYEIKLDSKQAEHIVKLSLWFVWYKEGLAFSLSNVLDKFLIYYDKKKRDKKANLDVNCYDLGYFYRYLEYTYKELPKDKTSTALLTSNKFINWIDEEYRSIHDWFSGTKYEKNEKGEISITCGLGDW